MAERLGDLASAGSPHNRSAARETPRLGIDAAIILAKSASCLLPSSGLPLCLSGYARSVNITVQMEAVPPHMISSHGWLLKVAMAPFGIPVEIINVRIALEDTSHAAQERKL